MNAGGKGVSRVVVGVLLISIHEMNLDKRICKWAVKRDVRKVENKKPKYISTSSLH